MLKKMFERLMPMYETDFTGGAAGGKEPEPAVPEEPGETAPEVAAPEEEPEPEGKEPAIPQTPQENAAFAAMRREMERLERKNKEYDQVLTGFFAEAEDPLLAAQASLYNKSTEQIRVDQLLAEEQRKKDLELEELRRYRAQSTFERDLNAIKSQYPDVKAKSIEELGEEFGGIMALGQVDAVTAYEIIRAKEEKKKATPPMEPGKVNAGSKAEKNFYTHDEVKAMTQEEVTKNWDKIEASRAKWD